MPPVPRPLSREESKLVTRHRLLKAGLAVLLQHGHAALTTGRVAQEAGVAQPTFYVHFSSMDALLQALASDTVNTVREALHEARRPLREGQDLLTASRQAYLLSVRALVLHADLLRLFMAERYRSNSTLGGHGKQLMADMAQDLMAEAVHLPLATPIPLARMHLITDALVALTIHLGLALAEGSETDEHAVVDLLCETTAALISGAFASTPWPH